MVRRTINGTKGDNSDDTEQTMKLINLLGQKRKESGLSVNEVARRANVDPGTVWGIEQGMIVTPRAESLMAIGGVLGILPADLFATVGWLTADELPTIGPYLRAKYGDVPDEAIEDIENHIAAVLEPYGRRHEPLPTTGVAKG
jgi:transcriptional regulator with XRE-family HTH domain